MLLLLFILFIFISGYCAKAAVEDKRTPLESFLLFVICILLLIGAIVIKPHIL